jgi:hypothetical protein
MLGRLQRQPPPAAGVRVEAIADNVGGSVSTTGPAPPVAVVRFPIDYADPITMLFIDATVEIMLVAKESIPGEAGRIARDIWGVAGVYVLLGPPTTDRAIVRARPGSSHDVLARIRQHPAALPWFTRALVARDTRQGWSSAEAGYLEGRLHELCRASPGIDHDFRLDEDRTLQPSEEAMLERRYLPAITAALQLAGAPIETRTP